LIFKEINETSKTLYVFRVKSLLCPLLCLLNPTLLRELTLQAVAFRFFGLKV
jgi:hypothetical protein